MEIAYKKEKKSIKSLKDFIKKIGISISVAKFKKSRTTYFEGAPLDSDEIKALGDVSHFYSNERKYLKKRY
jgi:hypothetical protein